MCGGEQVPGPLRAPGALAALLLLAGGAAALQPVAGWPVGMKVSKSYAPCGIAVADLDGDGSPEVAVASTTGRVYVWSASGEPADGWPVSVGGRVQSKPAAGDLDGDGRPELVVLDGENGMLWALDADGTVLPGWPVATGPSTGVLAPVIARGPEDEVMVIAPWEEGLSAWTAGGALLWHTRRPLGSVVAAPSVSEHHGLAALLTEYAFLYLYDLESGRRRKGFPYLAGQRSSWGTPVLADLEADGSPEVLFAAYDIGQSVRLYCLEADGSPSEGFPVPIPAVLSYSAPVCADADGDGDLEVFLCCSGGGGTVWAFDHTGALLPGWPASPAVQMEGSPSVADLDGDGVCEVLTSSGSSAGGLFCWDLEGRAIEELSQWGIGPARTDCPVVADLDGDGAPELLLLTADGTVHAWHTPGGRGRAPWPQLHRGPGNTSSQDP